LTDKAGLKTTDRNASDLRAVFHYFAVARHAYPSVIIITMGSQEIIIQLGEADRLHRALPPENRRPKN
jgi:hypothetical protein